MSVIRKIPFIENVLGSLSEEILLDLRNKMNSDGGNVYTTFATMPNKNTVTPVVFQLSQNNNAKTGLLIYTDDVCVLISYHRFQDLQLYNLNPTNYTYEKINEYCDINELRRVLDDTIEKKGAVDSGDAAEGSVPFADGEGGVTWDKPTEYIKGDDFEDAETTVKMVAIDDEGNLVKADLPEGTFVVDSALSNVSENPVQNKVITEELDKIKDGRTVVGKAQTAQALDNVSENSGSIQEDPFIFQGTGTNNNTSETPTSPKAHQLEKQGNTVVYNQTTPTITVNTYSTSITSDYDGITIAENIYDTASTHTWLFIVKVTSITANCEARIRYPFINNLNNGINYFIRTSINNNGLRLQYRSKDGNSASITVPDDWFKSIDLTQWFGSNDNIPAYLLAHPEAFINYYNGSLAYNEGQLVSSDGRYLVTIGFNQLNPATSDNDQFIGNYYIQTALHDYVKEANNDFNCYRIRVIPNTNYCISKTKNETLGSVGIVRFVDKDYNLISGNENGYSATQKYVVETPDNCVYMEISLPISADFKVCVNLSWDGERDGEYEDFVKHVYDTGTEDLDAFDVKHPTGVIERNTGEIDLSTLNWTFNNDMQYFTSDDLVGLIKPPSTEAIKVNAITSKYVVMSYTDWNVNRPYMSLYCSTAGKLRLKTGTSATTPTGIMQYELDDASKTTEQGTQFSDLIEVDDYGTMYWLDNNEDFVEVPQGCKLFYPADYALLIDDLGNYTNYDVTKLAKKSDLTDFIEQEDASNNITDVAGLTYKYKKLYKTGNVITLHVVAENGTGSDIAADSALFTLPSDYYSPTYNIKGTCVLNNNVVASVNIAYETGNVSCPTTALESGEYVYITLTYAIE